MKITFLGTGTSTGVPEIGCRCAVCQSADKRDKRLRSSVLVEVDGKNLLIDCGPDFRWQMLRLGVTRLDAVMITHEHYDHVGGLDDLRPLSIDKSMNIYAEANVIEAIGNRMPYVFRKHWHPSLPHFDMCEINTSPFEAAGIPVVPVRVIHGHLPILGYRIGNFAYLTDVKVLPDEELVKLVGLDVLVIEALKQTPHPSHETLEQALENIGLINPKQAFLTHMSHQMGLHAEVEDRLPERVRLAFDGLSVIV